MGMPFAAGMARASAAHPGLTPWFWGINGATSVCGSVFAVAISLFSSISTTYVVGVCGYGLAFVAFFSMSRARGAAAIPKIEPVE